jgi:hypothetical protein
MGVVIVVSLLSREPLSHLTLLGLFVLWLALSNSETIVCGGFW